MSPRAGCPLTWGCFRIGCREGNPNGAISLNWGAEIRLGDEAAGTVWEGTRKRGRKEKELQQSTQRSVLLFLAKYNTYVKGSSVPTWQKTATGCLGWWWASGRSRTSHSSRRHRAQPSWVRRPCCMLGSPLSTSGTHSRLRAALNLT